MHAGTIRAPEREREVFYILRVGNLTIFAGASKVTCVRDEA